MTFAFTIRAVLTTCLHWSCICMLCDWFKNFAPLSRPIRCWSKPNRDRLALVFPRFASATCHHFEFWLVRWTVCVFCDWPDSWPCLWLWDTQFKTAHLNFTIHKRQCCRYLIFFKKRPEYKTQINEPFTKSLPRTERCPVRKQSVINWNLPSGSWIISKIDLSWNITKR